MSRRIEVELTSTRDDGTWTWRSAGAKQPKGDLEGSLLFAGAKVGDVVRADADFLIDGIVITSVLAPKGARKEPERLEIIGPPRRDEELVTTTLAPKGRGDRTARNDRGDRRGRDGDARNDRDRRPRPDGDRTARPDGERGARPDGERGPRSAGTGPSERRPRPERPVVEPKPKPKRLRAGRVHRNAVLATLPDEQKPVAEQVLRGGSPAVRQAVEKQNEGNKAEGRPEISPEPLLALAEELTPALRAAEWHDRADAALADVAEIDLRDLRSVVVAADAGARDEQTRAIAEQLKTALDERVEAEQAAWLAEMEAMLKEGRAVRALRLSSRPPKAGTTLTPEMTERLVAQTSASLTADTGSDRFATVLDALAYSPVRGQVAAEAVPPEPSDALLAAVRKHASRMPQIASQFGVHAPASPAKGRSRPKSPGGSSGRPVPPPPKASAPRAPGAPIPPPPGPPRAVPVVPPAEAPVAAIEPAEAPVAAIEPAEAPVAAIEPAEAPVAAIEPAEVTSSDGD